MRNTTWAGWTARILCVGAILFVSLFALDAFEHGSTFLEKLAAFGMHLLPSVVLACTLWLGWKHELVGGILFCLIGTGMAPFIYQMNYERTGSVSAGLEVIALINLPFVIVGGLFLWSYFMQRKSESEKVRA